MARTVKIISIRSIEELPSVDTIRKIPRRKLVRLLFHPPVAHLRASFGRDLVTQLPDFQVHINESVPEIFMEQLITTDEIKYNLDFFEQCARDYYKLAHTLIRELATMLAVDILSADPHKTFLPFYRTDKRWGQLGDWNYNFHGFDCGFTHNQSGQQIEVSIVSGQEFGVLDPYFFVNFILSTKAYRPLKVRFYNNYEDGKRILQKMLDWGKLEQLHLNGRNVIQVKNKG